MRILMVAPMPPRDDAPGAMPRQLHAEPLGLRDRHDVTLGTAAGDRPGTSGTRSPGRFARATGATGPPSSATSGVGSTAFRSSAAGIPRAWPRSRRSWRAGYG